MARVHFVKKARKDNDDAGIKKGESYYWWANRCPGSRSGVKRYSKKSPRPSQTVGSPFLQQVYAIQEDIGDAVPESFEDLAGMRDQWVADIQEAAGECQEKLDNMPEGLQQGDTGQLLQERVENLENWASELENVDCESAVDDDATDEEKDAALQSALEEMQSSDPGV